MKKLRIGYQPYSADLSHPGDRRRVVFWAKHRGHSIITDLSEPVDVILLSERADFSAFPKKVKGVPIIFDLVDAYLTRESLISDWLRGTSKVLTGQLSGRPKPFTSFVEDLCARASAVICSSPEQRETIVPFSKNVHVILDSHDELPMIAFGGGNAKKERRILWEGMPATLSGLRQAQSALIHIQNTIDLHLNVVTDEKYSRLLGKYFQAPTSSLLRTNLGVMFNHSTIAPWSTENLISTAKVSDAAIIPITLSSPLQNLKPENRLLIMWRLGLPCLTSPSPSYIRVSAIAHSDTICTTEVEWISKLVRLFENRDEAESIVKRGQAYVNEFHNSDILLEKWDQAFNSVTAL